MNIEYDDISNKLDKYEVLFETDPNLSFKKMIDLYPLAIDFFNHEVSDAIYIWLYTYKDNNDIKDYLLNKISNNDKFKNIYQSLLNKLYSF